MQLSFFASQIVDGSMKSSDEDNQSAVRAARIAFLHKYDIQPADTTVQRLLYGGDDYCRYFTLSEADKGAGIVAESTLDTDALVVTRPNHAILLPLADCIGAVIYDEQRNLLMVSHLGRHNLEQNGGMKSVEYLIDHHQAQPKQLKVWLSPAAGKENYPLFSFNNRGLHEVASEQLHRAGVLPDNMDVSPIDTTVDRDYFSHSEYLKGNRAQDGRFAIVAVMREV